MSHAIRSLAAAALVALAALPAAAQEMGTARPALTRFRWPLANAIAYADTVDGVQLHVAASQHATRSDLEFAGSFEPAAVDAWAAKAGAVIAASGEAPQDAQYLVAPLATRRGSTVLLARQRDGRKWAKDVLLQFTPARGEGGFSIRLSRDEASAFGTALIAAASESAVRAEGPLGADGLLRNDPFDRSSCVRILENPRIAYPFGSYGTRPSGEVWATYVVDSTGRADPASLTPLLADHPRFVDAVRAGIGTARFAPATYEGRPRNALVHQRFVFAVAR